eukprot:6488880-Ditylum_brightwellii.AAC.1
MDKAQRSVTPVKSAGYHTSLVPIGRRQAEKDSSLCSLRIKRHGATVGRSNGAWGNKGQTDDEMESVEETELDLSMLEEQHKKNGPQRGRQFEKRIGLGGENRRTKESYTPKQNRE